MPRPRTGTAARSLRALLQGLVLLGSTAARAALAQESAPASFPELWAALRSDAVLPAESNPPAPAKSELAANLEARIEPRKSYAIPAFEIAGFDVLLSLVNRYSRGAPYHSSLTSIRHNLRHNWVVDNDPFEINQFGHPYQGSMYHAFARSAGLDFWISLGYTFAGSAFWEIAGETTPPSRNDQVASGIAGSFLGEALFRMASLLLERGGEAPDLWREIGAAAISPATGFNRLAFGERFRAIFPSHDAVYYSRVALGAAATTQNEPGASTKVKHNEAQVEFSIDYGLPGKSGYTYKRPFDYFAFQATASSANGFENIMTRGLLVGKATRPARIIAASGDSTGATITSRRRCFAFPARRSRSARPASGGSPKESRSRARACSAWALLASERSTARLTPTTITAWRRRRCSRCGSSSATRFRSTRSAASIS